MHWIVFPYAHWGSEQRIGFPTTCVSLLRCLSLDVFSGNKNAQEKRKKYRKTSLCLRIYVKGRGTIVKSYFFLFPRNKKKKINRTKTVGNMHFLRAIDLSVSAVINIKIFSPIWSAVSNAVNLNRRIVHKPSSNRRSFVSRFRLQSFIISRGVT